MKKYSLMCLAMPGICTLLTLVAACVKSHGPEPIEDGTWSIGRTKYTCMHSVRLKQPLPNFGDTLLRVAFGDDTAFSNMIDLDFRQPPVAGTYKIVYEPKGVNEVRIQFWDTNSGLGGSRDDQEQYLKVLDDHGKLRYVATDLQLRRSTFVVDYNENVSLNLKEK